MTTPENTNAITVNSGGQAATPVQTANRIGASLLTGVGLGATVGGVIWFVSTF